MPPDDNTKRYDDILKKIAERKPFGQAQREIAPQTPHDRVLDMINAFDSLAELTQRSDERFLCYGPKSLRGSAWSGVVIWYHSKGYHGYRTLNLLGVWTTYRDNETVLSLGIRQLPYCAPVYDPGVYRVAIQSGFKLYYDDDGRPPDENDRLLYQAPYDEKKRLAHRQTLVDTLDSWSREVGAP